MKNIGYYKDRTEEFKSIRNPQYYDGDRRIKPFKHPYETDEVNVLTDTIEAIKTRIDNISKKLTELHTYQQQYLSVDVDDYATIHNQIERHTNTIKYELKATHNEIIKFGKMKENENAQLVSNVQINLAEELNELTEKFKTQNKNYLIKLKQRMMKFEDCFTPENDDDIYTIGFDDSQMSIISEAETQLKDRMSEIKKITETVQELAEMSRELNYLIYDQGTIIDRIDYTIEHIEEDVSFGVEEIEKASVSFKKASRVKKIVSVLALLIIGASLVLLIKLMI